MKMDEILEKDLFEKYHSILRPDLPIRESLMSFGFECGDGWYNILDNLFANIKRELECNPIKDFYIIQVKEKFGSLRVYTSYSTERIEQLIDWAEETSLETCENCGREAEVDYSGWVKVLCPKCLKST
jgi:hypothetical protein